MHTCRPFNSSIFGQKVTSEKRGKVFDTDLSSPLAAVKLSLSTLKQYFPFVSLDSSGNNMSSEFSLLLILAYSILCTGLKCYDYTETGGSLRVVHIAECSYHYSQPLDPSKMLVCKWQGNIRSCDLVDIDTKMGCEYPLKREYPKGTKEFNFDFLRQMPRTQAPVSDLQVNNTNQVYDTSQPKVCYCRRDRCNKGKGFKNKFSVGVMLVCATLSIVVRQVWLWLQP